jgi:uncharacterized protein YjdB
MKKKILSFSKIYLTLILSVFFLQIHAQTLPGTYTTSWAGNTFVPAVNGYDFVQGWANSMYVESDGTIYTNANWDEGGKELGVYKNGQCIGAIPNQHEHADGGAITTNATYIWATVHSGKISRFNKTDYAENGTEFLVSTGVLRGLTASSTELFVSDFANNRIKVYNANTQGSLKRSWVVTRPGPLAMDATGNIWVLCYDALAYGPGTGACIKAYSPTGTLLKTVTLAAGIQAKSIAIDKTNNEMLVTDISSNMQVRIYNNINTTPSFIQSLGTQGGILSGTKGIVAPLKFNVPNLVGVDANHNIIVWSNGNNPDISKTVDGGGDGKDADGMGSCVESYTRAGVRNWQMLGLEFVDLGTFDPATDGADLYTKHEHFTMDYSKPDGQQWTWKGWTLDRATYANSDARLKNDLSHQSTSYIRNLNGQKFMFLNNMYGEGFYMYRTGSSEILIPCGELMKQSGWTDNNANGQKDAGETTLGMNLPYDMFAVCVDNAGTIWYAADDIRKHTLQSITNGVPVYNTTTPTSIDGFPAPFNDIRRIQYDSDNDVMYLTGYTATNPFAGDWGSCGLVLARYNNWNAGNRTALYTLNLPSAAAGDGANMVSMAVEKDYIFVAGVQTRGKVWVYNSSTGIFIGNIEPGANVGGVEKTGWCDLRNSIAAFKKSTGEYLITVEDDGWEKVLIYRWNPGTATNIATAGTGAVWSNMPTSSTDNTKSANVGINNGDISTDVSLVDVTTSGYWQAAGVTFATAQSGVTSVKYFNGVCPSLIENGVFSAGIKLQQSTDGTTWTDITGWTISPTYPYSPAASNVTYTFSGPALNNIKGIRVVGQVGTNDSWSIRVKEVQVFTGTTNNIPVTGVTLSPSTASIIVGATQQLTATIVPANATNQTVSYTTSASSVATVNSTGLITAVAAGIATIIVTTQDGNITAASTITVTAANTNIAPAGAGAIWSNMTSSTANNTKTANAGINDNDVLTDISLADVTAAGNWQAAGVTFTNAQSGISSVKYFNGVCNSLAENGVFSAGIKLQQSTNGTTWADVTGWTISPTYPYSPAASNVTYTFSGAALNNVKGIRVVGQVRTNDSWSIKVKEVQVFSVNGPAQRVAPSANSEIVESDNSIKLFPNPVRGTLHLSYKSTESGIANFKLYNSSGTQMLSEKIIFKKGSNNLNMDVSRFKSGVYLLHLIKGNKVEVKKVLIEE